MNIRLPTAFIILFLLSGCASAQLQDKHNKSSCTSESNLVTDYSTDDLINIITDEGYSFLKKIDDDTIAFKASRGKIILQRMSDGDLVLFFSINDTSATIDSMNKWNENYRLSRAYIDEDGDPVIESDLMVNGGVSKRHVSDFIQIFSDITVPKFIKSLH